MKTLTLHQPWASLVAVGAKTIETRSCPTKYRGRLAIHAATRKPTMDDVYAPTLAEGWRRLDGAGLVPLPLGAIVATCKLVDVVPILAPGEDPSPGVDRYVPHVAETQRGALWHWKGKNCYAATPRWDVTDVSDQRPYGDFTPGRYAWILADIKPTTERCPGCWGRGSWPYPLRMCCPVCKAKLVCDPVPAKGQRGLWEWTYTLPGVER